MIITVLALTFTIFLIIAAHIMSNKTENSEQYNENEDVIDNKNDTIL